MGLAGLYSLRRISTAAPGMAQKVVATSCDNSDRPDDPGAPLDSSSTFPW